MRILPPAGRHAPVSARARDDLPAHDFQITPTDWPGLTVKLTTLSEA